MRPFRTLRKGTEFRVPEHMCHAIYPLSHPYLTHAPYVVRIKIKGGYKTENNWVFKFFKHVHMMIVEPNSFVEVRGEDYK